MHSGAGNLVSDNFFNSKKEAAKRGKKSKLSDTSPSVVCRICLCSRQDLLPIGRRFVPKVLQGVALVK